DLPIPMEAFLDRGIEISRVYQLVLFEDGSMLYILEFSEFLDLSNYLEEGVPRPTELRKALNKLTVVPKGNSYSDWRTLFKDGVITAMEKLPAKASKPEQAEQNPHQTTTVTYGYTHLVSLIRFMRNGFTHIESFKKRETSRRRTLVEDLGKNASELEATFRSASPGLLVSGYAKVENNIDHLPHQLKEYYPA
ncbi:serine/threonine-protein kinase/endoribonuclease IRE1, partial [Tanacetum coccineum]